MNIALLRVLQARPDAYFWPESVARELQTRPARLLRDLRELEESGFGIERVPHQGVRYTGPAQRLCVDQIEWELGTRLIGRRIAVWQRVASTNDVAARAARSPSNDGLVVLAEEQTAGRGRRHRRWFAPRESSILMSVLVFPPESAKPIVALLTSLAAVAVADVLDQALDLPARIKWPNDVRVNGQKVCGILVESRRAGMTRKHGRTVRSGTTATDRSSASRSRHHSSIARQAAVIGIGVNVNIEPKDFPRDLANPATSLMALCGRRLDRSELARSLIQRLDYHYQLAIAGRIETIWRRWRERADLVGQPVRVELIKGELCGRLLDLWPDRGISLQLPSGKLIQLPLKEVLSVQEATT